MADKKKTKSSKKKGQATSGGSGGKVALAILLIAIGACAGYLFLKPSRVLVPSLIGKSEAEARQMLEESGLSVIVQNKPVDQPEQNGKVLTQEPASGTAVPRMSVVTLVLGQGPEGIAVPDLLGKTRSEAEDELLRLGFKVKFEETHSDSVPIGRVISHTPKAGEKLVRQGTVTLVVSGGEGDILVPDLSGMTVEQARAALEALGLEVQVSEVAQEGFRPGDAATVLRQEPAAGQTLSAGGRVTVFLPIAPPVGGASSPSGGTASHAPRFEGMTVGAARKLAEEQGVVLELADSADDSRVVTFQDPPPGDPLSGPSASVVIKVSDSAVVPGLSGMTESEARARLQKAGLSVGAVRRSYGEVSGEVLDQRPSAGIEAVSGSTVDLVISDPSAPPSAAQAPAPTPGFTPAPWVE